MRILGAGVRKFGKGHLIVPSTHPVTSLSPGARNSTVSTDVECSKDAKLFPEAMSQDLSHQSILECSMGVVGDFGPDGVVHRCRNKAPSRLREYHVSDDGSVTFQRSNDSSAASPEHTIEILKNKKSKIDNKLKGQ